MQVSRQSVQTPGQSEPFALFPGPLKVLKFVSNTAVSVNGVSLRSVTKTPVTRDEMRTVSMATVNVTSSLLNFHMCNPFYCSSALLLNIFNTEARQRRKIKLFSLLIEIEHLSAFV